MGKKPSRWRHWRSTVINLGIIMVLLFAVSFLPADTSLSQVRERGFLKLCVPELYPPLVTGNEQHPGYDIELVQAIARQIGVRLVVNTLPTIGRDFNPRNWMVTRGQCDMLAGGVADNVQTRNFMQTLPTNIRLGWMMLSPDGKAPVSGNNIVIIPGSSGLDRLQLSGLLRRNHLRAQPAQDANTALAALENGSASALIAENFTACHLLRNSKPALSLKASWLSNSGLKAGGNNDFNSYSLAISLWKGDVTLKRAIEQAMQEIAAQGVVDSLRNFYLDGSGDCSVQREIK